MHLSFTTSSQHHDNIITIQIKTKSAKHVLIITLTHSNW